MKTFKIKAVFLVFTIIVMAIIYSCTPSNPTPDSSTTVAQDKQNITNTIEGFYSCLNTLDDGDLSDFLLYSLFNNTNQTYNDTYLKSLSDKFELQYGEIVMNDKLQFATKTGIYTWNTSSNSWSKVANSSMIRLIFPSIQTNTTLDSELTLDAYNDTSTTFEANTYWLPTVANLTLKRNGTTLFSLNLSNVTFQLGTNFSMPISADVTIFTAPFTHTIQWRRTSSTDFQLTYNSSTPQGCGTSLVTNVKLYDGDYANIVSVEDDVKTVSGSITEGSLRVSYSINVEGISVHTDPTDAQINANSDAEVFYNDVKIGDLDYRTINNKTEIFIIYSDGTSENVNVYVGDFETTVRNIFENYSN